MNGTDGKILQRESDATDPAFRVDPRSVNPTTGQQYRRPRVRVLLTSTREDDWSALLDGAVLIVERAKLVHVPDGVGFTVLGPERDAERRTSAVSSREGTVGWPNVRRDDG